MEASLSHDLGSGDSSKHYFHGPTHGFRTCSREAHLPEIEIGGRELKRDVSFAIAAGFRGHNPAFCLLTTIGINQHQPLPNRHFRLQHHHASVQTDRDCARLNPELTASLGISVDDEVDAKRDASGATAFNPAEMKCSHSGANLSIQKMGPGLQYLGELSCSRHPSERKPWPDKSAT